MRDNIAAGTFKHLDGMLQERALFGAQTGIEVELSAIGLDWKARDGLNRLRVERIDDR